MKPYDGSYLGHLLQWTPGKYIADFPKLVRSFTSHIFYTCIVAEIADRDKGDVKTVGGYVVWGWIRNRRDNEEGDKTLPMKFLFSSAIPDEYLSGGHQHDSALCYAPSS